MGFCGLTPKCTPSTWRSRSRTMINSMRLIVQEPDDFLIVHPSPGIVAGSARILFPQCWPPVRPLPLLECDGVLHRKRVPGHPLTVSDNECVARLPDQVGPDVEVPEQIGVPVLAGRVETRVSGLQAHAVHTRQVLKCCRSNDRHVARLSRGRKWSTCYATMNFRVVYQHAQWIALFALF